MSDPSLSDVLDVALAGQFAGLKGLVPAKVTSFDFAANTVDAQPRVAKIIDGEVVPSKIHRDIPCVFLRAGPSTLTWHYQVGDDVLLAPADRDISGWIASRAVEPQSARHWAEADYIAFPPVMRYGRLSASDFAASAGLRLSTSALEIAASSAVVDSPDVRLGAPTGTDFVALATKVLTELTALAGTVTALVDVYDVHVHGGVQPKADPPNKSGPPTVTATPPVPPGSVAASRVRAK